MKVKVKVIKISPAILLTLLVMVMATSCEKFLEEENRSFLSDAIFYHDESAFDKLVAQVYLITRSASKSNTLDLMGTDIITRQDQILGTNSTNDYVNFTSENGSASGYWSQQYDIIAMANTVIDRADDIEGLSDADKTRGLAEVKFFRANAYFNLAVNFGGVPLVLHEVRTSKFDLIRTTEETIFNQVLSDLDDALAGVESVPSEYGRVSTDAVRHLKAKVLLTRGYKSYGASSDFTDAAALAETVISNHPLVSDFEQLHAIPNQRNSEVFFAFLYGPDVVARGAGNNRHQWMKFLYDLYPGMAKSDLYQRGTGGAPTPFWYSLFESGDERKDATVRSVIYAVVDDPNAGLVVGDTAIFFPETAWTQAQKDAVPYAVINPGDYFIPDGISEVHYPMFRKFDEPGVPYKEGGKDPEGTRDTYVMRSGETRLLAAEAYFKAVDPTSAAGHINALRSRAGLTTMVAPGDVDLDLIMDESARELIGEVSRWQDLKRTGTLISRVLANNPHAALNNALDEHHLLRPIPQDEIDLSEGTLDQNPGY